MHTDPPTTSRSRFGGFTRGYFRTAVLCAMCYGAAPTGHAQYRPADPRTPLFGEIQNPEALKYANAGPNDDLLPLEVNGYWGLLNQNHRVVALPDLDWTDVGIDGLVRATYRGKTGFILGNGAWRFDPVYPYVDRFEENYAVFSDGEKFGYLDKAGKVRLEPQFDAALRFREGWAGVQIGDRCGFINTRFRPTTELMFTAVRSFHENYAAVRLPPDATEELLRSELPAEAVEEQAPSPTDPTPEAAEPINPDMPPPPKVEPDPAAVGGTWAFLNKKGKLVYRDPTGDIQLLGDFNEGLARFQSGGRWGYMDKKFQVVVPPTYEGARDFTSGSAAVKLNGKWGYINRKYAVAVPFIYDQADDFDEALAMVTLDGKKGFIGRSGRVEIEPQFDWAEPFRLGVARVSVGDSFGYIKSSGYVFYDPRNGQQGIVDITAREQLRTQVSQWERFNRTLRPPTPRPVLALPYPPEYQYDEGLWVDPPPGAPTPSAPDAPPGGPNPDPAERV